MKKKLLSLLLVLIMTATLMIPSLAVNGDDSAKLMSSAEPEENVVLPEGGLVDGLEEKSPITVVEEPLLGASSTYSARSKTDAANYIRQQMVDHAETITLSVPVTSSTANGMWSEFVECIYEAYSHTGVPTEGDYLRYNINGYTEGTMSNKVNGRVTCSFAPTYRMTEEQSELVDLKVDQIVSTFGFTSSTSDYEKVRAIYDFLCSHISYASSTEDTGVSHSTYAALNLESTVCQGYSTAFYRLALECGLDARVVTGVGLGQNHGWNIVKIDGNWYYVDSTWDSQLFKEYAQGYSFFLKGSNSGEFPDHTANVNTSGSATAHPPEELSQVSAASYVVPLEIIFQTGDIYTYVGNEEKSQVIALGNGEVSYLWHITTSTGNTGTVTGTTVTTGEITTDTAAIFDGMTIYCEVSDSKGQTAKSEPVTIHILDNSKARLAGFTLSFAGDIAINYYMDLTDEILNSTTAYMHFTIPGETVKTSDVPVSSAVANTFTINGEKVTYYKFSAGVAAKDMTQNIHAEFYLDKDTKVLDHYYNIKSYADYIQNNASSYGDKAVAMVQAMLNYGGYAQTNFKYHTEYPASIDLEDISLPDLNLGSDVAYTTSGSVSGLTYKGSKLVLRTNTLIWHYFQTDGSISDYTFKVDGKTVTPVSASGMGDGWYRVEIAGVPAGKMDYFYPLTVTKKNTSGMLTVNYCVYSNIKSILDNPSGYSTANINMMKALYVFGEKTKAYFAK